MAEKQRQEQARQGKKAIFRIPSTAFLAIAFLVICMTPIALGEEAHWLAVLYLIPIAMVVFVTRTRTVADENGLTVRTMFGHRELPWTALKGLSLTGKARVRAVLTDDTQITLPTVRTRHLPVLSLVSDGRLDDPTGLTTPDTAPDAEGAEKTDDSPASPQE